MTRWSKFEKTTQINKKYDTIRIVKKEIKE